MCSLDRGRPSLATDYDAIHFASLPSTQDEARRRFAGRPLLVTADVQTAGRGRHGAEWLTAPLALAASLAWAPGLAPDQMPTLSLTAAVAAIRSLAGDQALKWPNDVLAADGSKVGGLIAEAGDGTVVVGFGANLWWPEPPGGIGAVFDSPPGPDAAAAISARWAEELLTLSAAPDWPRDEYVRLCRTLGREIRWDGGAGLAVGLGSDGGLIVETGLGRQVLRSGAVAEVRPATLPPSEGEA